MDSVTVHTSNKEPQTVEALGLKWLTEGQVLTSKRSGAQRVRDVKKKHWLD